MTITTQSHDDAPTRTDEPARPRLVLCPACDRTVSYVARACPQCGHPVASAVWEGVRLGFGALVVMPIIVGIVMWLLVGVLWSVL